MRSTPCGEGAAEGEACSVSAPCGVRLWCNAGTCAPSRAPRESCAADEDCPSGFGCTDTCVELPLVGEPCLAGRCWLGECVGGTCAGRPDGAACDYTEPYAAQCEGRCDATMTCAPRSAEGERCTLAADCADGLACISATCRPPCVF